MAGNENLGKIVFKRANWIWNTHLAIAVATIAPVLLIAFYSHQRTDKDLTDSTFARRQAIAHLAAATLTENLNRLRDISISLATRVKFRQLVSEGRWENGVQILQDVPKNFPFLDRLFLADADGTLMADTPALPGVRGKNFAHRDWYKGVSRHWQPYISEVYKRAAEPRLNVIAVASPVKSENEKVVGLLVMQVRLDLLLNWVSRIEVGPSGFVFVVDKNGRVAAHPKFAPAGEIMDFSTVPTVQKALQGERDVQVVFNPIEREKQLVAYAPVAGYGWGVIAPEPTRTAFAARDSGLRQLLITYGFIALLGMVSAYWILRTLSERKRVEEDLKGSEERFRSMAEAAYDAIVSADSSGNITYLNCAAERMFGYVASEVVGQSLTGLMPERFREAHRQGLNRFLCTGEARVIGKTVGLVGRKRDGVEFPLDLSLSTWETNGKAFFIGILRDTTERKRFEDEILDRNRQIEAANKELEAFSYSVSHDLRAPLRAINGFSRILLEEHSSRLPPEAQGYFRRVRESAQQMGQLIDDLLAFSRLSRQPLNMRPVNLKDVARQALEELHHDQGNRRIEMSIDDLASCQADPVLLKQVFVNLLSNALKFTRGREPAQIDVGHQQKNGEPIYFVRDNGVGFDMRYADKLFGVFHRLHRAEEFEGTGVGLAIVQRIIHRHGGRIWAEAEENKGATFYFTLGGGASHERRSG